MKFLSSFAACASATVTVLQAFIVTTFGWFYILSAGAILVFVVWLAYSRFGDFRLGGDDAKPDFNRVT